MANSWKLPSRRGRGVLLLYCLVSKWSSHLGLCSRKWRMCIISELFLIQCRRRPRKGHLGSTRTDSTQWVDRHLSSDARIRVRVSEVGICCHTRETRSHLIPHKIMAGKTPPTSLSLRSKTERITPNAGSLCQSSLLWERIGTEGSSV